MHKKILRQQYRDKRRNLTPQQHQRWSKQVCQQLIDSKLLNDKQHIACYLAHDGEVNTQPLINWLWQQHKHCYLPIIKPDSKTLSFALYQANNPMQNNQYGIAEPADSNLITAEDCDAIIAPLVAFDQHGKRLGMGGGYYDCTLASCNNKPLFIGLAFACQESETIQHEEHDVGLDIIVTENNFKNCR